MHVEIAQPRAKVCPLASVRQLEWVRPPQWRLPCESSCPLQLLCCLHPSWCFRPRRYWRRLPPIEQRFQIEPRDGGYVRLDRQTGQISFCAFEKDRLACRVAAEEREAYEGLMATLDDKLRKLEQQVAALEAGRDGDSFDLPPDKLPKEDVDPDQKREMGDAEAELNKALVIAEQAIRRFFEVVKDLRQDWEKQG